MNSIRQMKSLTCESLSNLCRFIRMAQSHKTTSRTNTNLSNLLIHTYLIQTLDSAPITKTLQTLGDRAVQAAAPKLWNNIPSRIQKSDKIDIFKRCLMTYVF